MSFEKLGKLFFSQIRPVFFFVLAILPLVAASLFLLLEYTSLQELQERFRCAARNEKIASARKERKERFLKNHSHANPYFLDQQIESLPLLREERKQLESLCQHPAFPNHQSIQERLAFLDENRLTFAEESIRTSAKVKETGEKQRHPVQMDENDLQKVLSLIEHIPIGSYRPLNDSPQIVIKDFRMKKQQTSLQTDIFEVEMDLLTREFIQ